MDRQLLLVSTAFLSMLAACSGPVNRTVSTQKAPMVHSTLLAHDVRFGGYDGLEPDQSRRLEEWLRSIDIAYGDRISVDDPVPTGAAGRRAAVAGVIARFGLIIEDEAPVTASLPAGVVRVVVTRTKITLPDCPDWRRKSNPEPNVSTMSNFGCASVSNLAAMVADPNDLLEGQVYAGADGHTTSKAINVFRERRPTGADKLQVADITTTDE